MRNSMLRPRITVPAIQANKNTKITALTAYDYSSACLIDQSDIDIVLVGDSLAGLIQGEETTLPVTLEQMIYHCRCVSKGVKRALLVGDMPFGSYQASIEQAVSSACRMIKEGGVSAVKLEGGEVVAPIVKRMVDLDIPVMGHIGLTPQSVNRMGGYKVQGRDNPERLIADAISIANAGAFSLVIEGVPEDLATTITKKINIPTIGIGAGRECDGQILVFHDLLRLHQKPLPKFVRSYADLFDQALKAINAYALDVRDGVFPGEEQTYR